MLLKEKYLKMIFLNLSILGILIISFILALETLLQVKALIRSARGGERIIPGIKYCRDNVIKPYGYCSLISHTKDVSQEELDYKLVQVYVDKLGGRVGSIENQKIDPKIYNNFLIGDSFVQADEIPFQKTIQGLSRNNIDKSKHIYGIGAGSWNSNQYLQVLNKLLKNNANYNFLLSPNDYFPNYSLSSWNQSKRFFLKYSRALRWIYAKIRPYVIKISNNNNLSFHRVLEETIVTSFRDCSSFESSDFERIKFQARTDHLVFSKHHSCWPEKYKISVDHSVKELKDIGETIYKSNSNVRFFILPFSISFKNEQTKGRLFNSFNFPIDKAISHRGLAEYLIAKLEYPVIDLENPIKQEIIKIRKKCPDCVNNFYLKYDGHLNPKAQKFLFDNYFN